MIKLFFAALCCLALASYTSSFSTADNSKGAADSGDGTVNNVLTCAFLDSTVEDFLTESETWSGVTNGRGVFQFAVVETVAYS